VSVREFARKVFRGQWPILVVGLFFLAAFILVIASYWRRGAVVLGVGVAVASVLRACWRYAAKASTSSPRQP
jgi:Protein of unknown function (DUF3017)